MIYSFKKSNGGGGTSNYNELSNKPQINGVTLSGNKTSQDLGITSNVLESVAEAPSAATNGNVYAVAEGTLNWGWYERQNPYRDWLKEFVFVYTAMKETDENGIFIGTLTANEHSENVYWINYNGDVYFNVNGSNIPIDYDANKYWDGINSCFINTFNGQAVFMLVDDDVTPWAQPEDTALSTEVVSEYSYINSIKQAYLDASGNTQYKTIANQDDIVTSYSNLENKPQINGVVLSGNVSSDQLGITSEVLETVSSIPSGASVGDVYAIYSSREDYYGWNNLTGSTVVFHRGINPDDGQDWAVNLGVIDLGDGYTRDLALAFNNRESLNDQYGIVFIGGIGNYDYGKIHTVSLDNDVTLALDLRDMQNFILSFEKNSEPYEVTITDPISTISDYTDIVNKTVQVSSTYAQLGHFVFGGSQSSGRYSQIQFWNREVGATTYIPNTLIGTFHYYGIMFKLYSNANGFYCIDYSMDSGSTWTNVYANMAPQETPSYYPLDVTDPNGKNILFKAWLYPGSNNDYGVKMDANKSMWIDDCIDPYGIVAKPMLKEGDSYEKLTDLPAINNVTLKGNMSTEQLGIELGGLNIPYNEKLQEFTYSADGSNVSGKTGFIIDWDGSSDMTYTAEAYYSKSWGTNSACTPYYSGGTWYNVAEWRNCGHTFEILPGNKLYYRCVSDASNWKFDGNYSGSTELNYINNITSAYTGALRTVYHYNNLKRVGVQISEPTESGTLTVSASTNDVITADYDYSQDRITGATFNGDPMQYDSEQKAYIATLSDGLTDARVGYYYVSLTDAGTSNSSKHASVTGVDRTGTPPGFCSLNYTEYPEDYIKDAYQYNGYTWDKLVKEYELPAPAPAGETWVPFVNNGFTYIRMDFNGQGNYGFEVEGGGKSVVELNSSGEVTWTKWGSYVDLSNGQYFNTNGNVGKGAYWFVKDGKVYIKVIGNYVADFNVDEGDNIGTNPEGCLPF